MFRAREFRIWKWAAFDLFRVTSGFQAVIRGMGWGIGFLVQGAQGFRCMLEVKFEDLGLESRSRVGRSMCDGSKLLAHALSGFQTAIHQGSDSGETRPCTACTLIGILLVCTRILKIPTKNPSPKVMLSSSQRTNWAQTGTSFVSKIRV